MNIAVWKKKVLFLATTIIFSLGINNSYAEDILVILNRNLSVYKSIVEELKKNLIAFSVKEIDVDSEQNLAKTVTDINPKIICAIGPKSAQLAQLNFKNKLIVFAAVPYPKKFGLVGENICGISLDIPVEQQWKVFSEALPNINKVGVIYSERTEDLIKEAEKTTKIELVTYKIKNVQEITKALENFIAQRVNALWIISDPFVINSLAFKKLLMFSFTNKIPLLCPARVYVQKGGFLGLEADYKQIGKSLAILIEKIANQVSPSSIGIQYPQKIKIFINANSAEKLGININEKFKDKADEIIK